MTDAPIIDSFTDEGLCDGPAMRSNATCPFPKSEAGKVAVKVVIHLGDEARKLLKLSAGLV